MSALPCNNVNLPPLPSGTGKYVAHRPHYASYGPHYAALRPTALWQHNEALGLHNVPLRRQTLPYPTGRGGILYHTDFFCYDIFLFDNLHCYGQILYRLYLLIKSVPTSSTTTPNFPVYTYNKQFVLKHTIFYHNQ